MAQRTGHERLEEELMEDNFSTTQQLALWLDSHGSTLNFTLETLAQHRSLINQLQDKVSYIIWQGERIEAMHEVRTHNTARPKRSPGTTARRRTRARGRPSVSRVVRLSQFCKNGEILLFTDDSYV
jgi:hypothetical protein